MIVIFQLYLYGQFVMFKKNIIKTLHGYTHQNTEQQQLI